MEANVTSLMMQKFIAWSLENFIIELIESPTSHRKKLLFLACALKLVGELETDLGLG